MFGDPRSGSFAGLGALNALGLNYSHTSLLGQPTAGLAFGLGSSNALGAFSGGIVPPPPATTTNGLLSFVNQPHKPMWVFVTERFTRFLGELAVTDGQRQDGETKQAGIRACLNRAYWGNNSETANSMLIGSWGKFTRVRPSRDIDILFLLPDYVYYRFQQRGGNRQSQLLQEVKGVLAETYPQTAVRGDGQVVVVPFNTIPIEVVPGFRCTDGSIIICDSNNGGFYKTSTAEAESAELAESDAQWNGNTRALARMLKCWQRECNVPLKSFQLERLAIEFLNQWQYSQYDVYFYDWMVRDFFAYLLYRANGQLTMPGTGEIVELGNAWGTRARTAYSAAWEACNSERDNYEALAGGEWRKIFGTKIPVLIS